MSFRDASQKRGGGAVKEAADRFTLPLDGVDKPRRGRPPKRDALTPAQRARAYRQRLKAAPLRAFNLMLDKMDQAKPAALAQLDAQRAAKKAAEQGGTRVCSLEEWPFPKAGIGC